MTQIPAESSRQPLRLWPGVVAAVLLVLVRFVLPLVYPEGGIIPVLGAAIAGLLILLWWMFFSRAPWIDRIGIVLLMIVAGFATSFVVHPSIRGGMMGRMLPVYFAVPFFPLALVAGLVASRKLGPGPRRASMVAAILLACAAFAIIRTDGITGEGVAQITWRWTPTAEERLLARTRVEPVGTAPAVATPPASAPAAAPTSEAAVPAKPDDKPLEPAARTPAPLPSAAVVAKTPGGASEARVSVETVAWSGFRGADRNGRVPGVRVETNWSASPPVELWRRPIGPGWSSFAVAGDLIYTQEQRGEHELVACYKATTGEPVWVHRDAARFYESNGGPGPRATPTLSDGRLYTFGATGILNALDAGSGAVVWSRNAATEADVKVPGWGFTGSPLVAGDLVVAAISGALAAYDRATGTRRWFLESEGGSYSSPQLAAIAGTPQILMMGGAGLTSVAPADGTVLWKHPWAGTPIVQPALLPDGDVLITTADMMGGLGMRRLSIAHGPAGWMVEERWTSRGLKPYFNDFVVHKGNAFGFDGSILAAIDLQDGARKWKGGRYGNGQVVLLPDQDLMLVLSEEGELALVGATADRFTEVARLPAVLEGKTWNHPVVVGDLVLVRNGETMAAFRLPLASR